ncbi:MAG: helix-turn-helix domain-containing protein [Candidatus Burarchaeum sp.]|nr:helix-turn-helix domain-containing protein [Candidatus Burarchaeum sp.]MDO8339763.1 helix-turn-helix domain-containing protein [Candidatus Burarchaeum sp.]
MQVSIILREKPARLLVALRAADAAGLPISALARAAGMSVVHASNTVAALSNEGLVAVVRAGREKRVTLTPHGAKISSSLDALLVMLASAKDAQPVPAALPAASPRSQQPELEFPQPPPQEKKAEPEEPPSE